MISIRILEHPVKKLESKDPEWTIRPFHRLDDKFSNLCRPCSVSAHVSRMGQAETRSLAGYTVDTVERDRRNVVGGGIMLAFKL